MNSHSRIVIILFIILIIYLIAKYNNKNNKTKDINNVYIEIMEENIKKLHNNLDVLENIREFKYFAEDQFLKIDDCVVKLRTHTLPPYETSRDEFTEIIKSVKDLDKHWNDIRNAIPTNDEKATDILDINMKFLKNEASKIIDVLYEYKLLTNTNCKYTDITYKQYINEII